MPMVETRHLRPDETALIVAMLVPQRNEQELREELAASLVEEMDDGGMGSLRFAGDEGRKMGAEIAEAEFQDEDGMPLLLSINVDQNGVLFELDIWRADYLPLIRFPKPSRP